MVLINEKEIVKKEPVYVMSGINKGKIAGYIHYENYKQPYYFVIKNWKASQIYIAPKHRNTLSVSEDILLLLDEKGIKNIVFMIVGMEERSFYYIVPLKDFFEGEKTMYDDAQLRIRINNLTRYYPEQEGLYKFL